jgi:hypothetical protein
MVAVAVDTSRQLYESEATGWQRGLYESVKATFRAPIVNWIFRTTVANYPEFARYMWGQVAPVFRTEAFADYTIDYRDAVLAAVEDTRSIPVYRCEQLPVGPAAYSQLRGQLATFDVVGPRLAVLFALVDRSLSGGPVGSTPPDDPATLAPFPDHVDRDRGIAPTMAAFDGAPAELAGTVEEIEAFHDLEEGLPSIYRCLVQWPGYLETVWTDLAPVRKPGAFDPVSEAAREAVGSFVESLAHRPRLSPDALRSAGFDEGVIEDVSGLFGEFNGAIADTVLPVLPVYAATVGALDRSTVPDGVPVVPGSVDEFPSPSLIPSVDSGSNIYKR